MLRSERRRGWRERRRWRMTGGGGKVRKRRPTSTHTCSPRRITTAPKQCLAQAGCCCCRSNKGEVWEGGDSRWGCARIGRTLTRLWCHPSPSPSALPCPSIHPLTPLALMPSSINTGSETEWICCVRAVCTSVLVNMSRPPFFVASIDLQPRHLRSVRPPAAAACWKCHPQSLLVF